MDFCSAILWSVCYEMHSFVEKNKKKCIFFRKHFLNAFKPAFNADINNVTTRLNKTKKSKFPERRFVFLQSYKNAFSEKVLQILKIVLSTKLISFNAPFWTDLLVHILLTNVSSFCNRKLPSISHTSGFGAKISSSNDITFVRVILVSEDYQWWS